MSDDESDSQPKSFLDRLINVFGTEPQSQEDLLEMLDDAARRKLVDHETNAMLQGVFSVASKRVRDVMIPRAQVRFVSAADDLDSILAVISESGHSRFPIFGESRDEVVGILIAKDLLRYLAHQERERFDLKAICRPAVITPESKRLNMLLREFRDNRSHMAIVVDEYGGVSGLVTIEDVLETIVGDIDDEHDIEEEGNILSVEEDGHYIVRALTPIEEFNEEFETRLPDDEYDTIGGLVIQNLGHLPAQGESVEFGGFHFSIVSGDSRRIHQLRVTPLAAHSEENE